MGITLCWINHSYKLLASGPFAIIMHEVIKYDYRYETMERIYMFI